MRYAPLTYPTFDEATLDEAHLLMYLLSTYPLRMLLCFWLGCNLGILAARQCIHGTCHV